jgi:LPS export ABC transporter protein LptC
MILAICGVTAVFIGYRRLGGRSPAIGSGMAESAGVRIDRVQQEATRNGVTEWRLDAVSANLIQGGGVAVFEEPEVTLFFENQPPVRLTAQEGRVMTDTNDIDLEGDVVIDNPEYILKTELLHYRHQDRALSSPTPVNILNRRFTLKADTVKVDMTRKRALFSGNVRGILTEGMRL